ncbi:MAG: type II toxin-antitoxin system VapC family toxin [Candidatus Omnitrophota bacterium]
MKKVLDASALITFLERGKGFEKVKAAMASAVDHRENLLMSVVNWGEVLYILIRRCGLEKAEQIVKLIKTLPIELVSADEAITREASLYKALQKLPYVDSFAAALAKIHHTELLTSDKEFQMVEKDIRISWV